MKVILFIVLFLASNAFAQVPQNSLVVGNTSHVCFRDTTLSFVDSIPKTLDSFDVIYLFSNSTSNLTSADISNIESFLLEGGGLYTGSDNWPLQAEANQITNEFYQKESFGMYDVALAQTSYAGNLSLQELDSIPAGKTTGAFPLDYRLTVEAWVEDQPLILTGTYGKGRIVIDTGYSRFYCEQRDRNSDALFERIQQFLAIKEED